MLLLTLDLELRIIDQHNEIVFKQGSPIQDNDSLVNQQRRMGRRRKLFFRALKSNRKRDAKFIENLRTSELDEISFEWYPSSTY